MSQPEPLTGAPVLGMLRTDLPAEWAVEILQRQPAVESKARCRVRAVCRAGSSVDHSNTRGRLRVEELI